MPAEQFVIDAHQHFWDPARVSYPWLGPELAPINRTIEFDELAPILERHGVEGTVLVQSADNDEDTDYMLEIAAQHPQVLAVVGYVPLERPDRAAARLDQLRADETVVGVRNLIHNQPDPDWLLQPEVDRSLGVLETADVSMDIVSVLPRHLEHVTTIAERHPALRLVIDHLSKPPIKSSNWEPWKTLITKAARNPNVYAKLSGLYPAQGEPDDWTATDLEPCVHFALELFGSKRLMYGGDWPISMLSGGYDKVWNELSTIFGQLTDAERTSVLSETAITFYRIPEARLTAARS